MLALASIGGAAVLAGAALALPAASRVGYADLSATDLAIGAGFTTIGALAVLRRPANRTGRLFLVIGVIEALTGALNHYAIVGLSDGAALPAAAWAGWLAYWSVSLVVPSGLFLALLLVFPDGRPVSRFWGGVAVAGIAFGVAFALAEILLVPRMEIAPGIEIDNPTNVASTPAFENVWILGMAILLVGVIGAVVRYRRSRGEERQQLGGSCSRSARRSVRSPSSCSSTSRSVRRRPSRPGSSCRGRSCRCSGSASGSRSPAGSRSSSTASGSSTS